VWENIPEPPALPNPLEELSSTLALSSNGEPTFASIGLGGWSPSGFVQQCMECFHVDLGLPWWSAIILG
jgi:YidC/Oxa1 family membrane protein insertase